MSQTIKWLIVALIVLGIGWFLYARGGEQPIERIEQPVEDPVAAA